MRPEGPKTFFKTGPAPLPPPPLNLRAPLSDDLDPPLLLGQMQHIQKHADSRVDI